MELTEKELTNAEIVYAITAGKLLRNDTSIKDDVRSLARDLQSERAKPKDDVWKNAPDNAVRALTYFYGTDRAFIREVENTRELPKTRADELAEETALILNDLNYGETFLKKATDHIKSAILKAQAEWEAGR